MKKVLVQENPDIVVLMETKISSFFCRRTASIWKSMRVEWEVLEMVRGNFSISISFLEREGEKSWVSRVYGPPKA